MGAGGREVPGFLHTCPLRPVSRAEQSLAGTKLRRRRVIFYAEEDQVYESKDKLRVWEVRLYKIGGFHIYR